MKLKITHIVKAAIHTQPEESSSSIHTASNMVVINQYFHLLFLKQILYEVLSIE